jgi:hypothetical protein
LCCGFNCFAIGNTGKKMEIKRLRNGFYFPALIEGVGKLFEGRWGNLQTEAESSFGGKHASRPVILPAAAEAAIKKYGRIVIECIYNGEVTWYSEEKSPIYSEQKLTVFKAFYSSHIEYEEEWNGRESDDLYGSNTIRKEVGKWSLYKCTGIFKASRSLNGGKRNHFGNMVAQFKVKPVGEFQPVDCDTSGLDLSRGSSYVFEPESGDWFYAFGNLTSNEESVNANTAFLVRLTDSESETGFTAAATAADKDFIDALDEEF